MNAESTLRSFVVSREPTALVFQGAWGVGKTYLWNEKVIKPHLKARPGEKYTYVSLFGINSLDDLKAAVSYASGSTDSESAFKQARRASPRKIWWWFLRMLPTAAAHAPSKVGGGPALARTISNLSFFALRDRLICIDDVERRGSGLSLKDVLGLVSFLKEQKHCRVCLILNADALALNTDDAPVWREQREKVFEAEITYEPTSAESVALGLGGSEARPWYSHARLALLNLDIKNVRLIRRVVRALTLAFDVAPARSDDGIRRVTRDIIMLVHAHSGAGAGAPPLEFVMRYHEMMLAFESLRTGRGEAPTPPEDVAWAGVLDAYEFGGMDDLRRELHQMVTSGFPRRDELRAAISTLEENDAVQAAKQRFNEAWRLYHDFVADNRDETLRAIENSWPEVSPFDHVMNLLGVVGMLRRNGRATSASAFIDQWLLERSGVRLGELDLRELQTFERITDQEFLDKREAFVDAHRRDLELVAAMSRMAERSYDERAIEAIAHTAPSDLANWMEENPGTGLPHAIKNTLELNGRPDAPEWTRAANVMREALLIVGAKSEWAAARIKSKYGVDRESATAG